MYIRQPKKVSKPRKPRKEKIWCYHFNYQIDNLYGNRKLARKQQRTVIRCPRCNQRIRLCIERERTGEIYVCIPAHKKTIKVLNELS